jgi:RimJ/RimL family protein N-acetyltransferase
MLRNVLATDLDILYRHQLDPEAAAMAVFPSRDRDAFMSHWQKNVLGDPNNVVRTILVDEHVAGYVSSWHQDGKRLVGYWVGKEYWGRGVASAALYEFLAAHERRRPIHAWVARSNTRSIRVLEKCGFRRIGESTGGSDGVGEVLFRFDGEA